MCKSRENLQQGAVEGNVLNRDLYNPVKSRQNGSFKVKLLQKLMKLIKI